LSPEGLYPVTSVSYHVDYIRHAEIKATGSGDCEKQRHVYRLAPHRQQTTKNSCMHGAAVGLGR